MAQVGGRAFNFDRERIERAMRNVQPETIREHAVVIAGRAFPPKQVVAVLTNWKRTSFTTMEAQRVLAQQGFASERNENSVSRGPRVMEEFDPLAASEQPDDSQRIDELANALRVAQVAIVGLSKRIDALEMSHGRH